MKLLVALAFIALAGFVLAAPNEEFMEEDLVVPLSLAEGPLSKRTRAISGTWCPWSVCNVITPAPGKSIGLRGGKDKRYCGLRGDVRQITCDGNPQINDDRGRSWAAWEKFTIVDAGDGKIAIKSARDGKYCADEGNKIRCNRDAIRGWEKFTIVDAGDGKIAIKSDRDGKYCADEGNTIKCNRDAIGGWEKFTSFGLDVRPASHTSTKVSIGTHNSYHVEPNAHILGTMRALGMGKAADSIMYTHPPIQRQLEQGLRTFEFDVYADPDGGKYSSPLVAKLQMVPPYAGEDLVKMNSPGFKVMHITDIDIVNNCGVTLQDCLQPIKEFSHKEPMYVLLEVKTGKVPTPPQYPVVTPVSPKDDQSLWDKLEAEVKWGSTANPPVRFLLDNGELSKDYMAYKQKTGTPRVLIPNIAGSASPPAGWSKNEVFLKCNDPTDAVCAFGKTINENVADGYLVRTRADADAAKFNPSQAKAALASGAQLIHTDFPTKMQVMQAK